MFLTAEKLHRFLQLRNWITDWYLRFLWEKFQQIFWFFGHENHESCGNKTILKQNTCLNFFARKIINKSFNLFHTMIELISFRTSLCTHTPNTFKLNQLFAQVYNKKKLEVIFNRFCGVACKFSKLYSRDSTSQGFDIFIAIKICCKGTNTAGLLLLLFS